MDPGLIFIVNRSNLNALNDKEYVFQIGMAIEMGNKITDINSHLIKKRVDALSQYLQNFFFCQINPIETVITSVSGVVFVESVGLKDKYYYLIY